MIGASEVGSVEPLVKEGQHVKKVRRVRLLHHLHAEFGQAPAPDIITACCIAC
jgi:hypothetical protein